MTTRIVIADDHEIVRFGLNSLIAERDELDVVAQAEDGREALELCRKFQPHIIIMDITMPNMNGIEASRQILKESPETRVIVLSMHNRRKFVTDMLEAGVSGYVLKNRALEDILPAIEAALAGETFLSAKIATLVSRELVNARKNADTAARAILTPREREVLQLIAEGKSTKQIAAGLHVSVKTIESTRGNIMQKTNINNIPDLTKYAIQEGLTSLDF